MLVSMDRRRQDGSGHRQETRREALHAWTQLLACTTAIERAVRRRLRARFATTLPRFDLLTQLDRAPQGLRMGEVSNRMRVTGGNVTGIVAQLVREGLVERSVDAGDRRASLVRLTDRGREALRTMADEHEGWIAELVGGLPAPDRRQLTALLGALEAAANGAVDDGATKLAPVPAPIATQRLAANDRGP